jgi:hypothetical protein
MVGGVGGSGPHGPAVHTPVATFTLIYAWTRSFPVSQKTVLRAVLKALMSAARLERGGTGHADQGDQ